jgi:fatty-acyl-CoA synthase
MASHSTIAKYALPSEVAFVPEIPHTATGKISKLSLRQQFKDYVPSSGGGNGGSGGRGGAPPRSKL